MIRQYHLISCKGCKTIYGTYKNAIAKARQINRVLRPSFGVTICDEKNNTIININTE